MRDRQASRQSWRGGYHTTRHSPAHQQGPERCGVRERRERRERREIREPALSFSLPCPLFTPPGAPHQAPRNHTLGLRMQNYASVINRGCYALDGAALANSLVYFHCSAPQGHTPRFSRDLCLLPPQLDPRRRHSCPLRPSLPQPRLLPVLGYRHTPRPPPSPLRHGLIKMGIARPRPPPAPIRATASVWGPSGASSMFQKCFTGFRASRALTRARPASGVPGVSVAARLPGRGAAGGCWGTSRGVCGGNPGGDGSAGAAGWPGEAPCLLYSRQVV